MLVVKLELWPHGDQGKARLLGELHIANDVTGTEKVGSYNVWMRTETGGAEVGRVRRHQRKLGAWELARKALGLLAGKGR
jgi:hypothetical protein